MVEVLISCLTKVFIFILEKDQQSALVKPDGFSRFLVFEFQNYLLVVFCQTFYFVSSFNPVNS